MTGPALPGPVRRIVIIRIGKIGDLIVSNFAFRKIRESFPDARILLVTLPRNRELLRYNRTVDRVRFFHRGLDLLPLVAGINAFRPDMVLDFNDNPSTTSRLISRFCPARIRAGFNFPGRHLTHPVECPPHDRTHITERLRLIPEAIGLRFSPDEVRPSMELGTEEAGEVQRLMEPLRREGMRCVAVNLSAGDPSRYWPADRWSGLLTHISSREASAGFMPLTAPGERHLAEELQRTCPSLRFFPTPGGGFHHFAAAIAQADLLLSPDTSAIHIAAAFRVPVLGLYPAVEWNYRSWQPLGTRFEVVRPPSGGVGSIGVESAIQTYDRLVKTPPVRNSGLDTLAGNP